MQGVVSFYRPVMDYFVWICISLFGNSSDLVYQFVESFHLPLCFGVLRRDALCLVPERLSPRPSRSIDSVMCLRRMARSSLDITECACVWISSRIIFLVFSKHLRTAGSSLPDRLCYPNNFNHSHQITQSAKMQGMESEIASFGKFAAVCWH